MHDESNHRKELLPAKFPHRAGRLQGESEEQIQNNKSLMQIIIDFFIFKSVVSGFSIYGEFLWNQVK